MGDYIISYNDMRDGKTHDEARCQLTHLEHGRDWDF